MQPLSTCRSASSNKISLKSDNRLMSYDQKKRFSRWRLPPSWILQNSIFGHVTVIGFNIWCRVPNFIKIGRFFTEIWIIWRFNDFQNGGCPPCWILKICSFCHVALVDLWLMIYFKCEVLKSIMWIYRNDRCPKTLNGSKRIVIIKY